MTLSERATIALERAESAYKETINTENVRSRNRAETRFYAACESLFHALSADKELATPKG